MKITGGKYRGKNIEAREVRTLRPTSSFIREAIFNILKHGRFLHSDAFINTGADLLENQHVVDIFCGTGALGIEALLRGAKYVTFIDEDSKMLALTRQNIEHINEADHAGFIRSDSTLLPRAKTSCMLAFIDPPYNQNLAAPALESLRDNGWLAPGAVAVVEQGKRDDPVTPTGYQFLDDRVHDKTRITVLQYVAN